MAEGYDYVVIGGGSAGGVAAARQVSGGERVHVLGAGQSHRHPLLDMPPGIFKMINGSRYMRYHRTVPQAHLDGRVHDIPQGHVLGGGSSVNAQVYMRGRPGDYDAWDRALRGSNTGAGWGWDDVLPSFTGMEANNRLADARHGTKGPVAVSDPGHINEMSRWFVQAMQRLGLPFNADFNGATQHGVGFYQFTNSKGRRSSTAIAFLEPLRNHPGLTIRLGAEVARVAVKKGRAHAVVYRDRTGTHTVAASAGIVLAAGALMTPKLLMVSGIGPAAALRAHGIDILADSPGVGQNLIDHPEVPSTAFAAGRHG